MVRQYHTHCPAPEHLREEDFFSDDLARAPHAMVIVDPAELDPRQTHSCRRAADGWYDVYISDANEETIRQALADINHCSPSDIDIRWGGHRLSS